VVPLSSKTAHHDTNRNEDCTGAAFPLAAAAPLPAGATLINVADFVEIIGEGAICNALL
jgi:hypothetical protein